MVVTVTFGLRRTEPFGGVQLAGRAVEADEVPVSDDPVDEQIWTAALAASSLRVLAGEPL